MTIDKMKLSVIQGTTCFAEHERHAVKCMRKSCKQWIKSDLDMNCVLLAAKTGGRTLQEIGDILGLTRVKVCQTEKQLVKMMQKNLEHKTS